MRRNDDVVHFEQRIVRRSRLFLEDIETCAHDFAVLQRLYHRRLIHGGATAGVDEVRGGLHSLEKVCADQFARLVVQRGVHGHEIGVRCKLLQCRNRPDSIFLCNPRRAVRVVSNDIHSQRLRLASNCARDVPERHQPERLPVDRRHRHNGVACVRAPPALAHQVVQDGQLLRASHQHQDCVVRHLFRAEPRAVDDHHSLIGRGVVVNMVEAVAANYDRLRRVYLLDDLARHLHAAVQDDIRALAGFDDLTLRLDDAHFNLIVQTFQSVLDERGVGRRPSYICYFMLCQFNSSFVSSCLACLVEFPFAGSYLSLLPNRSLISSGVRLL